MRITFKEYGIFLKKFDENEQSSFPLRMGQLFCNLYGITDPVLFYETDNEKAVGRIMDEYLEL